MTTNRLPEEVSRHKCLVYDGQASEHLGVVVPFLIEGLRDHYRCLTLAEPGMIDGLKEALGIYGVDADAEVRRGALVLSSDRSHLDHGGFDPCTMIEIVSRAIEDAVRDGFAGLCATGDMAWELGEEKNFKRLLEYEALLEQLFRDKPLIGICQYRSDTLPAGTLRDALLAHRSVYLGEDLRKDNLFFVPPNILLGTGGPEGDVGRWMCEQIRRVMRAERDRDEALSLLLKSEGEQRDLDERLAAFNRDLERRVRERTDDLESFAFSVSHDLRAPLRAMSGYAEMMLDEDSGTLTPDGQDRVQRILHAAGRMKELIDALLELARTGRTTFKSEEVDMTALALSAIQELSAERDGTTPTVGDLPRVSGDRDLLRQVFVNLIGNAIKYSAARAVPVVTVGAAEGPDEITYWVRDNGVGFDMKDAGKLFEVFQRLHSREEFEGSGVGLALVKRIIQRHGGRVWAEGRPDGGATFSFALPRKRPKGRPA